MRFVGVVCHMPRLKRCKFALLSAFSISYISQVATFRKLCHYSRDAQSLDLTIDIKFAADDRGRFFKNDFEVWAKFYPVGAQFI